MYGRFLRKIRKMRKRIIISKIKSKKIGKLANLRLSNLPIVTVILNIIRNIYYKFL